MKRLQTLLYRVPLLEVEGELERPIRSIQFDSRHVAAGDLFVAIAGTQVDGHNYIPQAIAGGAVAVVAEHFPQERQPGVTYLRVRASALALGHLAANYYENPSDALHVIGVTGTNGKTTTVTLLYQLFRNLGYPVGLIGTVESRVNDSVWPATHTTPDPVQLQYLLREMVDAGCSHAFMEVSSHAAHQERIAGIQFAGGVFTNLTHDHLDYHGTFANYLAAKKSFFDGLPSAAFALTNTDDRNGAVMLQNTRARTRSYAFQAPADYKGRLLEQRIGSTLLQVDGVDLWSQLSGGFNAYNLLAAYGVGRELGIEREDLLIGASQLKGADGRFQVFQLGGDITGIVDYAHTPDALENLLRTVRAANASGGRIWVVFGCGGDRDRAKRPGMGTIAASLADKLVLTSDNPRTEPPERIIDDILTGIPDAHRHKVIRLQDRREAIHTAARMVQPGDVLVIAGKGHETYQIIGTEKRHFDDREELQAAFASPATN